MGEVGTAVTVTTTLDAKPGREEALGRVLHSLAETVRREEPGCLLYQPVRSRFDAARFLLVERYRDEQSLFAHANSAHLRDALAALMECLVAPPALAVFSEIEQAPRSGARSEPKASEVEKVASKHATPGRSRPGSLS